MVGAPNTNRTCDLPLRRGLLYPLSYRGDARILAYIAIAYHVSVVYSATRVDSSCPPGTTVKA